MLLKIEKEYLIQALFSVFDHCLVTFWVENKKGSLETLLAKNINIKVLLVLLCNN
jgi:hypothetical protein